MSRNLRAAIQCALTVVGTVVLAPGVHAQVDTPDFDAELEEIRTRVASGRWSDAHERLLELVATTPSRAAVLRNWAEIDESLARCAFWEQYDVPDPRDVVSGDLLSWKESSGDIKLRYRSGDAGLSEDGGDFLATGTILLHPLKFKGTYHIEIKGDDLPAGTRLPVVFVSWNWDTGLGLPYAVAFGDQTAIFEVSDGLHELDRASTLIRYGRDYSFKVSVAKSSISAFYNGKRLLKAKRPKGDFGQFGFSAVAGLEEVVITGEVEPAWIAGLLDARIERDWSAFRKTYDPLDQLPEWVAEGVRGDTKSMGEFGVLAPGPPDPRNRTVLQNARSYQEKNRFRDGLTYALELNDAHATAPTRDWLAGYFLYYTGKPEQALDRLDRLCESDADFFPGRLLRARLVRYARPDESEYEIERLVADFPDYVDTYEELVDLHMQHGNVDEAERALDVALDCGVPAGALRPIALNILRARQGPTWRKAYEYSSKNYVVRSDLSRDVCFEISQELEKFYRKYSAHVRRPARGDGRKFQVYFFSGEAGYHTYCEDLLGYGADNTLGLFSMGLKQLLIWNSPEKASMMRTVRHEGFHQYLDRISGEAPVWLHEGMAEYFEESKLVGGKWRDGQVNEYHVRILDKADDWTPIEELAFIDHQAFRANNTLHYAESWAFVHFLWNHDKDSKRMLDTLLDELLGGADRKQALETAFADVRWAELELDFHGYVASLEVD